MAWGGGLVTLVTGTALQVLAAGNLRLGNSVRCALAEPTRNRQAVLAGEGGRSRRVEKEARKSTLDLEKKKLRKGWPPLTGF